MTAERKLLPRPALLRLTRLAALDQPALSALERAAEQGRSFPARKEIYLEGDEVQDALLLLDGWAVRVRQLADGGRQVLSFILPGDLIGQCGHLRPRTTSTILAITGCTLCKAPPPGLSPTLEEAYSVSRALDEAHLLSQIVRLGRMDAHDRIVDVLLELLERLELAGIADRHGFAFPLTQETLADALGLTSVHVNRMVQQARRAGELEWAAKRVVLHDPDALRASIGRHRIAVRGRAAGPGKGWW